jgi:hypothetical protein
MGKKYVQQVLLKIFEKRGYFEDLSLNGRVDVYIASFKETTCVGLGLIYLGQNINHCFLYVNTAPVLASVCLLSEL